MQQNRGNLSFFYLFSEKAHLLYRHDKMWFYFNSNKKRERKKQEENVNLLKQLLCYQDGAFYKCRTRERGKAVKL